jgi:hypothetical protein
VAEVILGIVSLTNIAEQVIAGLVIAVIVAGLSLLLGRIKTDAVPSSILTPHPVTKVLFLVGVGLIVSGAILDRIGLLIGGGGVVMYAMIYSQFES